MHQLLESWTCYLSNEVKTRSQWKKLLEVWAFKVDQGRLYFKNRFVILSDMFRELFQLYNSYMGMMIIMKVGSFVTRVCDPKYEENFYCEADCNERQGTRRGYWIILAIDLLNWIYELSRLRLKITAEG